MPAPRLPPLNALRAFEAAARHLSVKAAAQELCVTPGAVSQMIKTLEQHLGVALFLRVNRGIQLTDAGHGYLPPVRNAFRQILAASARVAQPPESRVLVVSTTAFFASAWLIPRLADFHARHPGIDLQIVTSNALTAFGRDGADIAIRHGLGRYPGLRSEHLLTVEVVPVASAELAARMGAPRSARDLLDWPRVHDETRNGWQLWFAAQGIEDAGLPRGPAFDDGGLLLKAVAAGQGAGLLPAAMVADELAAGRLVRLADDARLEEFAYYLVWPGRAAMPEKARAFRDWLSASGAGAGG
ncbi:transcriptional regulator GcvA [Achromobacter agilis]|uniref:Glycine cleavage system transcriptional activator n=1 Tax=Achromobacter agilis TaxID=1353888 RepID=A0A446CPS2_9BURK|nr:transcriptional regulator GcvA [Achromobacter agilis]SSW69976.1 Glycine cleavage system transcriptional activator [Achromobacter agilis]